MKKFMKTFKFAVGVVTAVVLMFFLMHPTAFAKRDKQYVAKQIRNIKIDGNLGEWKRAEIVAFDELKDVGDGNPKASDFTGQGRVAWSAQDATRIYFAVEITDDKLQDVNPPDARWWEDDSVEFMFDFDNGMVRDSLVQWTLGANGKDLSAAASKENTEWVLIKKGNDYIYEVAIDPTKPRGNPQFANPAKGKNFKAENGLTIGLSFHSNDCEGGGREHQIGWMPGGAWDALFYGDLIFDDEVLVVEPSGKLAVVWGSLKQ
jgi:hypothetical protein